MSNKTISFGVFSSFKMFSEVSIIYSLCKNVLVDSIDSVSENGEILNVNDHAD